MFMLIQNFQFLVIEINLFSAVCLHLFLTRPISRQFCQANYFYNNHALTQALGYETFCTNQ